MPNVIYSCNHNHNKAVGHFHNPRRPTFFKAGGGQGGNGNCEKDTGAPNRLYLGLVQSHVALQEKMALITCDALTSEAHKTPSPAMGHLAHPEASILRERGRRWKP